jgi:hypothetical protein
MTHDNVWIAEKSAAAREFQRTCATESEMTLIEGTDLADLWRMDQNLTYAK